MKRLEKIVHWLLRFGIRGWGLILSVAICAILVALALATEGVVHRTALWLELAISAFTITVGFYVVRKAQQEAHQRRVAVAEARDSGAQLSDLFEMTDMLQAAETHEDAGAILIATARRLLPDYGGSLWVFNNSRDRLDLTASWGADFPLPEFVLPHTCWALKRGKAHINHAASGTLVCNHRSSDLPTIEVPMLARGQLHGLLVLRTDHEGDPVARLKGIARIAQALADSISLALSNIALRDRLRTQSLRDPLTDLYNRRYMEDALERYVDLAERSGSATSVLMIDLDNFKRLNDSEGHAKGDAVLRDVASQLVSGVRPADVVSRYGGEELVVLMPNCGLDDAALRAEGLRERIEGLSQAHGIAISASIGVACVPETAGTAAEVVPIADTALYAAKADGKNCVRKAERRAGARNLAARDARKGEKDPAGEKPLQAVG